MAPKVHRATIKSCLKDDLPPKHEFVLCVPPTKMQRKLYEVYVSGIQGEYGSTKKLPQTQVFSIVNDLVLLCNHPRCFRQKVLEARQGVGEEGKPAPPENLISAALKETNSHDLDNPALSGKAELLSLIRMRPGCSRQGPCVQPVAADAGLLVKSFNNAEATGLPTGWKNSIGKRQDMIKTFQRRRPRGLPDIYHRRGYRPQY